MEPSRDEQPISEARANLTELVASVRLLRRCVFLTRRDKPQAVLLPIEVGDLVVAAGGVDAALKLFGEALRSKP